MASIEYFLDHFLADKLKVTNHKLAHLTSGGNRRLSRGQKQALAILDDEVFMQPWFVPKPIYLAIRRLVPTFI